MMQIETLDAIDPVILPPPIGGPVRSAGEQAMQHGEEDGAFECKPMLALTRELLDDGPAPVSSHNRSNTRAGPMRRTSARIAVPSLRASTTIALAAKRAPDRRSRSNWPLSCRSSTRPSVAITCWRTCAPSSAFDDLKIAATDDQSVFLGAGGQTLGRRGYSKDHRPDLRQMILAVLLDGDGRPVCTEMWPGNTADTGSLVPRVVDRPAAGLALRAPSASPCRPSSVRSSKPDLNLA